MILLTIVVFVIILGLLVFVHELGHFMVAKKSGMKVDEFGFGFPPRIFGIKKGETTYSINLIPLGGFVRIEGENGDSTDPQSFGQKPAWQRFLVLIAGVSMNVVLAWVAISIALMIGWPTLIQEGEKYPANVQVKNVSVGILDIADDSPAKLAGLKPEDYIIQIAGEPIDSIEEAQTVTKAHAGQETTYTIKRGNDTFEKKITPRANPPEGQGALGIALGSIGQVMYPWYEAPVKGLQVTVNLLVLTVSAFYSIIAGLLHGANVGQALAGPVGIAVLTRDATAMGFVYLLRFTALISVNLAIINVLPFPALDGGRLLFLVIEKLRRRKMDMRVEQWANTIGFVILISLMLIVTVKDVSKYSEGFKRLFQSIF
ncbi:MAG: RIP metalloprotease RseP [Candidatus Doudnabacteria bacterium]|nr:RIP metalloprotease RseP [Candidatus Doudnabacteria bacterium]